MVTVRNTFIKSGLIRPCVPTPLVKNERGQWVVQPKVYNSGVTSYPRA